MTQWIEQFTGRLPAWAEQFIIAAAAAVIGIAVALLAYRVLFRLLKRLVQASATETDDVIVQRLARPARYAFVALGIAYAARETPALDVAWEKVEGFVMPFLLGWIVLGLLHGFVEAMVIRADITVADNRDARRRRTRLAIFSRIGTFIIVFVTVALMLLGIPGVRNVGVTLMASAGLAGLAVGAAAQPALKSLIAGIQMALTEPIRIGDLVVIEGESGRVEDIRTTYVVIRTGDDRRLIVPTAKFLESTFQNWTRVAGGLTGTVVLPIVPGHEIALIRAAFEGLLKQQPDWDKRVGALQVSDVKVDTVELKLVLSAANPAALLRLRLAMREAMVEWLRVEMPEALRKEV